jgi:hypothetical protein
VLTLNIAKKKCWNKSGDEHTATMSFVFIISTVGVSPRKQKATKAVATCSDCLPKLLAFNRPLTSRDAQVMDNSISDALEALTGRRTQLSVVYTNAPVLELRTTETVPSLKSALSIVGKHAASVRWGKRKETKHGGSKS